MTFSVSSCTGEKQTLRVPYLEFLGVSCSVVIMTALSEDFLPGLDLPLFSGLNQQSFDAWFIRPQCVHFVSLDWLCLGHTGFVFLVLIDLNGISIVGTFKFTALCFECLHDFKFFKIINSALKIELIQFNVRTKNDRLPFFRLRLVEDARGKYGK